MTIPICLIRETGRQRNAKKEHQKQLKTHKEQKQRNMFIKIITYFFLSTLFFKVWLGFLWIFIQLRSNPTLRVFRVVIGVASTVPLIQGWTCTAIVSTPQIACGSCPTSQNYWIVGCEQWKKPRLVGLYRGLYYPVQYISFFLASRRFCFDTFRESIESCYL